MENNVEIDTQEAYLDLSRSRKREIEDERAAQLMRQRCGLKVIAADPAR